MLEHFAERDRENVSSVLAREVQLNAAPGLPLAG
jgi:hypothetical protein